MCDMKLPLFREIGNKHAYPPRMGSATTGDYRSKLATSYFRILSTTPVCGFYTPWRVLVYDDESSIVEIGKTDYIRNCIRKTWMTSAPHKTSPF